MGLSSITVFGKEYFAVDMMAQDIGKCSMRPKFKELLPDVEATFEVVIDKLVQADKLLALRSLEDTLYEEFD